MEDKKNYQKPTVKVVELKKKGYLICTSPGSETPPESEDPTSGGG
jgi:hypothetical protein